MTKRTRFTPTMDVLDGRILPSGFGSRLSPSLWAHRTPHHGTPPTTWVRTDLPGTDGEFHTGARIKPALVSREAVRVLVESQGSARHAVQSDRLSGILPDDRPTRFTKLGLHHSRSGARLRTGFGVNLSPAIPSHVDFTNGEPYLLSLPFYLNDQLGTCTVAAAGHTEIFWNAWSHRGWRATDGDVLAMYGRVSGYNGDPATDRGAWEMTVLSDWGRNGLGGHRIYRWEPVNFRNLQDLREAVWFTVGGVQLTLALPQTAVEQFKAGVPWSVVGGPGSEPYSAGGHEVEIIGYTMTPGPYYQFFEIATWGRTLWVSPEFIFQYATEAHAVAGGDMYDATGHTMYGGTSATVNWAFSQVF